MSNAKKLNEIEFVDTVVEQRLKAQCAPEVRDTIGDIFRIGDGVAAQRLDADQATEQLLGPVSHTDDIDVKIAAITTLKRVMAMSMGKSINDKFVAAMTDAANGGNERLREAAGVVLKEIVLYQRQLGVTIVPAIAKQDDFRNRLRNTLVSVTLLGQTPPEKFRSSHGALQLLAIALVINHQEEHARDITLKELTEQLRKDKKYANISERETMSALKSGVDKLNKTFGRHSALLTINEVKTTSFGSTKPAKVERGIYLKLSA